jgi:hypothetical protein
MMWITHHEAIEMYARFCRARYSAAAAETVRATANQMERKGDSEGHRVWSEVAAEIEKQERSGPH